MHHLSTLDSSSRLKVLFLGYPNAGKSTLLNALLGTNISIVTHKRNTTTHALYAIITKKNTQIVCMDTPGIPNGFSDIFLNGFLKNKMRLQKGYFKALSALDECDLVFVIADIHTASPKQFLWIKQYIQKEYDHLDICIVLNKIDTIEKQILLPMIHDWNRIINPKEIFLVSALKKDGILDISNYLFSHAKKGSFYFHKDKKTDMSQETLITDVIRKHIMINIHEEIPYNVSIILEKIKEFPKLFHMDLLLIVKKDQYKGILLGHKGNTLKKIVSMARIELESLLKKKIFLKIFVKVRS